MIDPYTNHIIHDRFQVLVVLEIPQWDGKVRQTEPHS